MNFFQNKSRSILSALLLLSMVAFWSCVKTEFDEPPAGGVPVDITANTTIKELKKLHLTPAGYDKVKDDLIIGGEVIMDDASGNYYKTLVIQDASGGIEVKFNDGYLSNTMPIGRKIFIRCKDLILTDYNGLTQLTGSTVVENGVPSSVGLTAAQVLTKVVKGEYAAVKLAPKKISVADKTNPDLLSTLVELDDVQFTQCDAGKPYADVATKNSLNRLLEDCSGNQLIVRTSGYANFASQSTPTGNGKIVGVMSVYGSDYQLYNRDLNDVNMTGGRCGTGGGTTSTLINLNEVRSLFTGTTTAAPAGKKIHATVISDRTNKNLNSRNIYVQDGTAGIVVRFDADHCFEVGDEIEVDISGMEISEFKSLLQLNNVPLKNASIVNSGKPVTPRATTVADIITNFNSWESTLVTIPNVSITGAGTWAGNGNAGLTVSDGTGSIVLFTSASALFANLPTPAAGTKVTLTAIVSDFNGKQLLMRNSNDAK
ncbi:MAG: DUF5689 domain-containing protein [Bacteroidota bacterium]